MQSVGSEIVDEDLVLVVLVLHFVAVKRVEHQSSSVVFLRLVVAKDALGAMDRQHLPAWDERVAVLGLDEPVAVLGSNERVAVLDFVLHFHRSNCG